MHAPKIVISEFMDKATVDELGTRHSVLFDPCLVDDRKRLLDVLAPAQALIVRNRTRVDGELLAAAPHLRVVGRLGVGLDNIDLAACKAGGVAVCPATGANADAVAEYVIAAAMILRRGAFAATRTLIDGAWPRNDLIGREIAGARLGLVGFGGIARTVAVRASTLGMKVSAFDPHVAPDHPCWWETERLGLEELLETVDVISLHVPLTDETRGLVDARAIAAMKPGVILINTARGGIVDERAVAGALRTGQLGGAALDVFAAEPLTAGAAAVFRDTPNLILTPHIAGLTEESNIRVSRVTVGHVLDELARADR